MTNTLLAAAITAAAFSFSGTAPAVAAPASAKASSATVRTQGAAGGDCATDGICLVLTIGTAAAPDCGTATELEVDIGEPINVCYTMTNHTATTLNYQTLNDSDVGEIFLEQAHPIEPGGTYQFNRTFVAGHDLALTASWTAQDAPSGFAPEVTADGCADRVFADGFDGTGTGCSGGFVDIAATGVALNLEDDGAAGVSIPFSFDFYGLAAQDFCVGNNGIVFVGRLDCGSPSNNESLPSPTIDAMPAILPLWDDFDFGGDTGNVYWQVLGEQPNRRFVVEWHELAGYGASDPTDTATFEMILDEADGSIRFEYQDAAYYAFDTPSVGGATATIGLQRSTATYAEFSSDTAHAVADGSGITWSVPVVIRYTADSAAVTIDAGQPIMAIDASSLSASAASGQSTTVALDIANIGERDLVWSLSEAPARAHFPIVARTLPSRQTSSAAPTTALAAPVGVQALKPHLAPATATVTSTATIPAYACERFGDGGSCQVIRFDLADPDGERVGLSISDEPLFGATFIDDDFSKEYVVGSIAGELKTIDTVTGAITVIGTTTRSDYTRDLAWDRTNHTLYATGVTNQDTTKLYTMDPTSGAMTSIGVITTEGGNQITSVMGLAVSPAGLMYGIDIASGSLIAIDKATAAAATIGSLGFNAWFAQELDFNPSTGDLYLASTDDDNGMNAFYKVDVGTGVATRISNPSPHQLGAMAIALPGPPCSQAQDMPWLSTDLAGASVVPSGSSTVNVTLDASGLASGTYSATLCVASNDYTHAFVAIPVEFTVVP